MRFELASPPAIPLPLPTTQVIIIVGWWGGRAGWHRLFKLRHYRSLIFVLALQGIKCVGRKQHGGLGGIHRLDAFKGVEIRHQSGISCILRQAGEAPGGIGGDGLKLCPGSFLGLLQSIFLLRKALTDTATASRYIITLPGIGYQLGVAVARDRREFAEAAAMNSSVKTCTLWSGGKSE